MPTSRITAPRSGRCPGRRCVGGSLGYLESDEVMVEGDRVHSGLTDLRVHDTGHVVKEN